MEQQAHHIQVLLADQLSQHKEKEVIIVHKHVEKLQEVYQNTIISQDKGKQREGVSILYFHHYHLHQVDHLFLNQFSYKKKLITWRKH